MCTKMATLSSLRVIRRGNNRMVMIKKNGARTRDTEVSFCTQYQLRSPASAREEKAFI